MATFDSFKKPFGTVLECGQQIAFLSWKVLHHPADLTKLRRLRLSLPDLIEQAMESCGGNKFQRNDLQRRFDELKDQAECIADWAGSTLDALEKLRTTIGTADDVDGKASLRWEAAKEKAILECQKKQAVVSELCSGVRNAARAICAAIDRTTKKRQDHERVLTKPIADPAVSETVGEAHVDKPLSEPQAAPTDDKFKIHARDDLGRSFQFRKTDAGVKTWEGGDSILYFVSGHCYHRITDNHLYRYRERMEAARVGAGFIPTSDEAVSITMEKARDWWRQNKPFEPLPDELARHQSSPLPVGCSDSAGDLDAWIDTTPMLPEPPASLIELAAREIPNVLANIVPSQEGTIELIASHLAKRLQGSKHTLAAAQWAIHEGIQAGQMKARLIGVDFPSYLPRGSTEWQGGEPGTVAIPKGRPAPFESFKVIATESLWTWWRSFDAAELSNSESPAGEETDPPFDELAAVLEETVEDTEGQTHGDMKGEAETGRQPAATNEGILPTRPNKLEWLAKAMLLVRDHPEWSDSKIADEVGVNKGTLSRRGEYQIAADLARVPKKNPTKGHVDIDAETGERRGIEAYLDDNTSDAAD